MTANGTIPDLLYHTTLTVVDYHADSSGSTRCVYVLGTHTTLKAAKAFTARALQELNYEPKDFATYTVRSADTGAWTHGDGVIVYAKAPTGQEFLVGIDTKPNTESLPEGANSQLNLPKGTDHLHYVLQTRIDYNQDRSGSAQSTEIVGSYLKRADALAAAKKALLDGQTRREDFAQYDERDSDEMAGEWPFGEDVIVHAVAQTGENFTVAVRTVPGAHKQHAKNQ